MAGKGGRGSSGGGRGIGSGPVRGVTSYVAKQSGGRKTALALVFAIGFAQMLMSGRAQSVWHALWGPAQPLSGGGKKSSSGGSSSSGGGA